jgi:hypothetical protein
LVICWNYTEMQRGHQNIKCKNEAIISNSTISTFHTTRPARRRINNRHQVTTAHEQDADQQRRLLTKFQTQAPVPQRTTLRVSTQLQRPTSKIHIFPPSYLLYIFNLYLNLIFNTHPLTSILKNIHRRTGIASNGLIAYWRQ